LIQSIHPVARAEWLVLTKADIQAGKLVIADIFQSPIKQANLDVFSAAEPPELLI